MAKNLERIGDHATNMAEDVIYYMAGRDVRHPALDSRWPVGGPPALRICP